MGKVMVIVLGIVFIFLLIIYVDGRMPVATNGQSPALLGFVPNEILVKFKPDAPESLVRQKLESVLANIVSYLGKELAVNEWTRSDEINRSFLGDPDLFHLRVPASYGEERALSSLSSDPWIEYAEKNAVGQVFTVPEDTYFNLLWGLHHIEGQGGTPDADIDAPEAWDIHTGSTEVVVAITDSGIDYTHVDLDANIWTNPAESGAFKNDGIDNDNNGYEDDWIGWDFKTGNPSPGNEDNDPMDEHDTPQKPEWYHGTHVAGIVGAEGNNDSGVVGVCWDVKLMALKITSIDGLYDLTSALHAIDYAIANGAHIINASWGQTSFSPSLLAAIERARAEGIIFVAAAGNDYHNDNDIYPRYPASYDLDNIISVLSTDNNDQLSGFSNCGLYSVDLGAPGGSGPSQTPPNIFSTKRGDVYQYHGGTSFAAPYVSGVAALLWGQRPELSWWENKTIILKSVNNLSSLIGKARSQGRLNAFNSLTWPTPVLPNAPTDLNGQAYPGESGYDIELDWIDNSDNESGFIVFRRSGNVYWEIGRTAANVTSYWDRELPAGYWYYYVRAYRQDGESTKTPNIAIKAFGSSH